MTFDREKWDQSYREQQEYIEALKEYWDKFNRAALQIAPEFQINLWHGSYGEERYRFDFDQYEDATTLKELLEEQGFSVLITEPIKNTKETRGRKYFEVTQADFVSKEKFKEKK